ncbi:hypothetical protein MTO96_019115 [Rhipicephalus appendiculatus]
MKDDDQPVSRWLQSLQTNNTLEVLAINLSCFAADDCLLFLEAVATNNNLTEVNVDTIMPRGRVAEICELIRSEELVDRLFIRTVDTRSTRLSGAGRSSRGYFREAML